MMFLILFTLLGTVLSQLQLAAVTYVPNSTCNLESEAGVEIWINSAADVYQVANLVVNSDTSLNMNKLTLEEVESEVSKLERITSASISAIDNKLDVTATGVITEKLDVTIGQINLLSVVNDNDNNKVYVKTAGGVQTTGLYITSDDGNTLHLTYDILNKLIEYSKTLPHTSSRL